MDLGRIIELIDQMQEIDTTHIEPLRHPVDLPQNLRKDIADLDIETEIFQDIAPKTEDGFYLVPRVIEWILFQALNKSILHFIKSK